MRGTHLSNSKEWMNLGPVIQSEVRKKEKNECRILMHIYVYAYALYICIILYMHYIILYMHIMHYNAYIILYNAYII